MDSRIKNSFSFIPFLLLLIAVSTQASQGYVTDSRGAPFLSGSGECVRTSFWKSSERLEGCDAVPDRIILLPGPDGKVGAVVVETDVGSKVLDQAYAAVDVDAAGTLQSKVESAASVGARYGTVLAAQPRRPESFILKFESGSATELTRESLQTVKTLENTLSDWPAPEIRVTGHTDTVGKLETNDRLSLQRAETVVDILIRQGVDKQLIESAGRGERELLVPTQDNVPEARNRRVEINIR